MFGVRRAVRAPLVLVRWTCCMPLLLLQPSATSLTLPTPSQPAHVQVDSQQVLATKALIRRCEARSGEGGWGGWGGG